MIRRRSHLHRRLGVDFPVFTLTLPGAGLSWDDDRILSLSLVRGSDDAAPGVVTNTATLTVRDTVAPQHDQPVSVALTAAGATHLAGLVGNRTAAQLTGRWYGRLGRGTVTDAPRDELRTTQWAAADWLVELTRAQLKIPGVASGDALPTLVTKALTAAGLPISGTVTSPDPLSSWAATVGTGTLPWADVVTAFLENAGGIVQQTRAGGFRATNLRGRRAAAVVVNDLSAHEPLTRRMCRPTATWEQPTSDPTKITWVYTNPNTGAGVTKTYRKGSGSRTVAETVDDVTQLVYFQDNTVVESFTYSMEGRAYRAGGWGYRVPSVRINLLRLLTSDLPADRRMAGQLLTYEPGDVVMLLHDWPDEVKGHHIVAGITEEVSPGGWEVELALAPAVQLLGSTAESGDFALPEGLTWDTGRPRTETWNTIPNHDWNGA